MPGNAPQAVIEWANNLSAADLCGWMRDRLNGRDQLWPIDRMSDEDPHHLLETLFRHPEVRPETKFYLADGAIKLLREALVPAQTDGAWTAAGIESLCLLMPTVVASSSLAESAREVLSASLRGLATSRPSLLPLANDLLRTLLDLGYRGTPAFWLDHDNPADPVRNVVVCQALWKLDEERMFSWLETRSAAQTNEIVDTLFRPLHRRCKGDSFFCRRLRSILNTKGLIQMATRFPGEELEFKLPLDECRIVLPLLRQCEQNRTETTCLITCSGSDARFLSELTRLRDDPLNLSLIAPLNGAYSLAMLINNFWERRLRWTKGDYPDSESLEAYFHLLTMDVNRQILADSVMTRRDVA